MQKRKEANIVGAYPTTDQKDLLYLSHFQLLVHKLTVVTQKRLFTLPICSYF